MIELLGRHTSPSGEGQAVGAAAAWLIVVRSASSRLRTTVSGSSSRTRYTAATQLSWGSGEHQPSEVVPVLDDAVEPLEIERSPCRPIRCSSVRSSPGASVSSFETETCPAEVRDSSH